MKKTVFIFSTIFCAALATLPFSCKSSEVSKDQSFSSCQGDWQLVLLMKDDIAQTLFATDLSITPQKSVFLISGVMGANNFSSRARAAKNGEINFDPVASTKMGVTQKQAEFESVFTSFLESANSYKIGTLENQSFETLELKNAQGDYAHFIRNSIFNFAGSSWKLRALNTGSGVESIQSEAAISFQKNKEKRVAKVFSGLNRLELGVAVTEGKNTIQFFDGPSTLVSGDPQKVKIERVLLENLFKAERYSISGGVLSFYAGQTLLAEFEK